ncbi:hypothetical protein [Pseudomonas atacamensis]|uniref:hypothetical protein n=1 Tax=Pseudomonas atacamensis TaxID=2565368 RepID=UPI00381F03A8
MNLVIYARVRICVRMVLCFIGAQYRRHGVIFFAGTFDISEMVVPRLSKRSAIKQYYQLNNKNHQAFVDHKLNKD